MPNRLSKLASFMPHMLHTMHQLSTQHSQQKLHQLSYDKIYFIVILCHYVLLQLYLIAHKPGIYCPTFKHRMTMYVHTYVYKVM